MARSTNKGTTTPTAAKKTTATVATSGKTSSKGSGITTSKTGSTLTKPLNPELLRQTKPSRPSKPRNPNASFAGSTRQAKINEILANKPSIDQIKTAYGKLSLFQSYKEFELAAKSAKASVVSDIDMKVAMYYFGNSKSTNRIENAEFGNYQFSKIDIFQIYCTADSKYLELFGLIEAYEKAAKQKKSKDLLPIKGIDLKMKAKLIAYDIIDLATLVFKCAMPEERMKLAIALGISAKSIDSWVRQADLLRVSEMDADTAFMLVQMGVRHVGDLSNLGADKAYPILHSIFMVYDGFNLISETELSGLIANAKKLFLLQDFENMIIPYAGNSAPTHLFAEVEEEYKVAESASGKIVREGLEQIKNVIPVLPLPRVIKGQLSMRGTYDDDDQRYPFANAKVEIDGIVSPAVHKTGDGNDAPFCYTDSAGYFYITMPDRYTMQEVLALNISDGMHAQKFMLSSRSIIDNVPEQVIIEKIIEYKEFFDGMVNRTKPEQAELDRMQAEINKLDIKSSYIDVFFDKDDDVTTMLAKINSALVLESDLGEYIIIEELFNGLKIDKRKSLPSVKLMGENDTATHLESDTMPSRVFNYSLLHRLIEPDITQYSIGKVRYNERIAINSPVDVMSFKTDFYQKPTEMAKMASLGMGYVLNMNQAWVPDGFSLGTLLYSLILAPGEEQRIVVREKQQSYFLQDSAEGSDAVSEAYDFNQQDEMTATLDYAVNSSSKADSSYNAKTSGWSIGASVSGGGAGVVGALTGGYSSTTSKGSAKASQTNAYNEGSAAANAFNASIQSASQRLASAKRMSISSATSSESDSVATKIIANHNHSHTLTIQYWEVMRRYKLETSVSGVELVLFVPLDPINFRNPKIAYDADEPYKTVSDFRIYFKNVLDHYDSLYPVLPAKYKHGLARIKYFSTLSSWKLETEASASAAIKVTFNASIYDFENLDVFIKLKDGTTIVGNNADPYRTKRRHESEFYGLASKSEILETIQECRLDDYRRKASVQIDYAYKYTADGGYDLTDESTINTLNNGQARAVDSLARRTIEILSRLNMQQFTFSLPEGTPQEDIASVEIKRRCNPITFKLFENYKYDFQYYDNIKKDWIFSLYLYKTHHSIKDNTHTDIDEKSINYYAKMLPESFHTPYAKFTSEELLEIPVEIKNLQISGEGIYLNVSSSSLVSSLRVPVRHKSKLLRLEDAQKMKASFEHIVENTLDYSQVIWRTLSTDERIMMLERYTIQMDMRGKVGNAGKLESKIPLLNCVNVHNPLGFYGNCLLLPFVCPQDLSRELGKTSAQIQDELYRYHTNGFRSPVTTITLPTSGMVAEAVLSETNVSEKIDLTRFWNWKDSPINSMEINSNYLDNKDYLANVDTMKISSLGLQSATAATPIQYDALAAALINRQSPEFANITGQDQLQKILSDTASTTKATQTAAINASKEVASKTLDYYIQQAKLEEAKLNNNASSSGGSTGGASGNSSGTGSTGSTGSTDNTASTGSSSAGSGSSSGGSTGGSVGVGSTDSTGSTGNTSSDTTGNTDSTDSTNTGTTGAPDTSGTGSITPPPTDTSGGTPSTGSTDTTGSASGGETPSTGNSGSEVVGGNNSEIHVPEGFKHPTKEIDLKTILAASKRDQKIEFSMLVKKASDDGDIFYIKIGDNFCQVSLRNPMLLLIPVTSDGRYDSKKGYSANPPVFFQEPPANLNLNEEKFAEKESFKYYLVDGIAYIIVRTFKLYQQVRIASGNYIDIPVDVTGSPLDPNNVPKNFIKAKMGETHPIGKEIVRMKSGSYYDYRVENIRYRAQRLDDQYVQLVDGCSCVPVHNDGTLRGQLTDQCAAEIVLF